MSTVREVIARAAHEAILKYGQPSSGTVATAILAALQDAGKVIVDRSDVAHAADMIEADKEGYGNGGNDEEWNAKASGIITRFRAMISQAEKGDAT